MLMQITALAVPPITMASIGPIFGSVTDWLSVASGIIAVASTVTAMTPTPRDDRFIGKAYRFLEMLALNIGRAKDLPPNKSGQG